MTIIFLVGKDFWIEQLNLAIQIPDAAGETNSGALTLERPGNCIGFTATVTNPPDNDNSQAIGIISLEQGSGGSIASGQPITSVRATVIKEAGTAGNTNISINISLLMRATGPISV